VTDDYRKSALSRLDFDFEGSHLARHDAYLTLSRKDVLGIVQSALDELGWDETDVTAVKKQVFEEVADGALAQALRTAIIGVATMGRR
jgi:hypothetical protein